MNQQIFLLGYTVCSSDFIRHGKSCVDIHRIQVSRMKSESQDEIILICEIAFF